MNKTTDNQETQEITIRNDFHHTETAVQVRCSDRRLSAAQVRRIRQALCGVPGCTCGGLLGECGPQQQRWTLEPLRDGGVQFEC